MYRSLASNFYYQLSMKINVWDKKLVFCPEKQDVHITKVIILYRDAVRT